MSNASQTAYSFVDRSPIDSGGAKFMPLIRSEASVSSFTMLKGIGTSPQHNTSIMFSSLAVGTHTQTSPIKGFDPFTAIGGVYLDDVASSRNNVSSGQGKAATINNMGELHVTGASRTTSLIINSVVLSTSRLIHGVIISGDGVTAGDTVLFEDGDAAMFTYSFTNANETKYFDFGGPLYVAALNVTQTISGGTTSATLILPAGIS